MPRCRVCDESLEPFLDLGPMPLADRFVAPEEIGEEPTYPLVVCTCDRCAMVQLAEAPAPTDMFHADYPYLTSGSATMRAHFGAVAASLLAELDGRDDPFVVELGCNDGAMLHAVAAAGVRHVGVEPSAGVAGVAEERGVRTVVDFFAEPLARTLRDEHGRADALYAANTLCHIEDLPSVLAGIDVLLADDGVFRFEDPYLGDIVAQTAFDQIYDEHVFYFSIASVDALVAPFGFELVDVEPLAVHGGELRYTVTRRGARPPTDRLARARAAEEAAALTDPGTLAGFAQRVRRNGDRLVELLVAERDADRRVVGYGATAKSATVTNYCGLTTELVEYVCDSTPAKQGTLTPGAHLPVRTPEEFRTDPPDTALLFAWNHAAEIMANEGDFTAGGGRWLRYVPEVGFVDDVMLDER